MHSHARKRFGNDAGAKRTFGHHRRSKRKSRWYGGLQHLQLATFSGKRVLYIEDIYVEENFRGNGLGRKLFDEIISTAKELECIKIEWKCLSWNTPAQKFYHSIGGSADPEWLTYTLDLRKD